MYRETSPLETLAAFAIAVAAGALGTLALSAYIRSLKDKIASTSTSGMDTP